MPILLILALGASVYFIATGVAEAARREPCSDEAMRNLILTSVAIFKQRVDGQIRVSPEAEAAAKALGNRCQEQLKAFLAKNPLLHNQLSQAQTAFLKSRGAITPDEELLRKRDELFRASAK